MNHKPQPSSISQLARYKRRLADSSDAPLPDITQRELTILDLVSQGVPQKCIGSTVGVSTAVVGTVLALVRLKLNAKNTPHAIRIAMEKGLLGA